MSSLATFCAIVASLIGTILLGSITPASAYRSLSLERDLGKDFITFSESAFENTTLYYAVCDISPGSNKSLPNWQKCVLHRVQANFEGGSPKENSCNFDLFADANGFVVRGFSKIDPLGKDRAIVRWAVSYDDLSSPPSLRFSVVNFSNCQVERSSLSEEKDQLIKNKYFERQVRSVNGHWKGDVTLDPSHYLDFDWPIYLKEEDDFEIVSIENVDLYGEGRRANVLRAPFNPRSSNSKVETWFTYASKYFRRAVPYFFPLSKSKGHLFIAIEETRKHCPDNADCHSMTVALVQPNGERQNLTRTEGLFYDSEPLVSLANGVIGICAHQNLTTMQCTQFRLGDKEIKWFSTSIVRELKTFGRLKRAIYNLPRGEGFLTHLVSNFAYPISDKYLLKIGLDGKVKQFVDPDMRCELGEEAGFDKIFEDDRGNYCVSSACVREIKSDLVHDFDESGYIKLRSKCFEPEDFKDVSKYIIDEKKKYKMLLIE